MEIKQFNERSYKVTASNTWYHIDTPNEIINTIERAIYGKYRVKIKYKDGFEDFTGYTKDGLNVSMYIGKSNGSVKIPLHIPNKRSYSGGGLSTNLIESIEIKY